MSRFGPDPRAFFDAVYRGKAPWDVGRPQPALVALLDEHPPASPVLDVGCGSGDLAIYLARSGLDVLGIDFSEGAIAQARKRAGALGPKTAGSLDFLVGDALRPSVLQRRFGAVVDSGFLHVFDPDDCDRFAEELATVLRPGGRYYLLAFTVKGLGPYSPRGISTALTDVAMQEMPAIGACIERLTTAPV